MIIYKDVFTGDELISDSFNMTLEDGVVYSVPAKYITISTDVNVDIGANASQDPDAAPEDDGPLDSSSKTVLDIVHFFRLVEAQGWDKKGYKAAVKAYMKRVLEHLQANKPDEVEGFQRGIQPFILRVLEGFDNYQLFMGESTDVDAMLVLCTFPEGMTTPTFYFFKHGLTEMKC